MRSPKAPLIGQTFREVQEGDGFLANLRTGSWPTCGRVLGQPADGFLANLRLDASNRRTCVAESEGRQDSLGRDLAFEPSGRIDDSGEIVS
ncbi:hypothetical protein C7271_16120 [filamentous cyanobacterium CCP5]|nr:hypothetical protein C7271_16120 [filamentous cyanobacterium CCP5]